MARSRTTDDPPKYVTISVTPETHRLLTEFRDGLQRHESITWDTTMQTLVGIAKRGR